MTEHEVPERRLSDEARARRRTELMEAIADERSGGRRWLAPLAAAAVVAGLVGGGYVVTRLGADDDRSPEPERSLAVAGSGSATDSGSATPSVEPTQECGEAITLEELEQSMDDLANGPMWTDPAVRPSLRSYRQIVARHLDPDGQHLEASASNVQAGGSPACGFAALGTKLGWSVGQSDGLGMIQVEVAASWQDSQTRYYLDGWRIVPLDRPGVAEARVAEAGGRLGVVVTRTDGLVVSLIADPLFGNNSTVPVAGFDFTVDDLLATAADPKFELP